jgi:hypothetical protein
LVKNKFDVADMSCGGERFVTWGVRSIKFVYNTELLVADKSVKICKRRRRRKRRRSIDGTGSKLRWALHLSAFSQA